MIDHLLDTNILLRWINGSDPQNLLVRNAIVKLGLQSHPIFVTSQNIIELWSVATRPLHANGLGMSPAQVSEDVRTIKRTFNLVPDHPAAFQEWKRIVVQYGVSGKQIHDAHIAAAMLANRITRLLTFNLADFSRYAGITAVHPRNV